MRRKVKYMNYEAYRIVNYANYLLDSKGLTKETKEDVESIVEFVLLKNKMYYGFIIDANGNRLYLINTSEKLNIKPKSVFRKHNDVTKSLIYLFQKSNISKVLLIKMMEECDHFYMDLKNVELDGEFIKKMEER
jgi:hypothetical protein|nr:MAG TPA: hypothetical protein [Bacteriophage sp.]